MTINPTDPAWTQPSLLPEDEAILELRVSVVRGVPGAHVTTTITRPDGSWLACTVHPPVLADGLVRSTAARHLTAAVHELRRIVGPF